MAGVAMVAVGAAVARGVETPPAAAQLVQDKRIVDCLLQGQVRRLGNTIYQSPPRPVRIPAVDCAIRGGDFLVYDRGSFAASMAHWLDLAKSGDINAQIYLAQMFERGLGNDGQPDYAQAAVWYRVAAEAGNSVAQIGLAQLYEKGLGVERDPAQAKLLYQQAFGVAAGAGTVELDPRSVDDQGETIRELQQQLAAVREESKGLAAQLRSAQEDLSQAEGQLQAMRDEEQRLQAELMASRAALARGEGDARTAERARAELEANEERLREQLSSISRLQSEIARGEKEISSYKGQLQESSDLEAALREQSVKYQRTERELQLAREALNESNQQLASQKAALEASRESLGDKSERLQELESRVARYQAESRELQRALDRITRENEELIAARQEAAEYRQQTLELEDLLAAANSQLAEVEKHAADTAEEDSLRAELDRLRNEAARYQQRIADLEATQAASAPQELAGPTVYLIEPVATNTRGGQEVHLPDDVAEVALVGRVEAPAGLLSLKFNQHPVELNDRNVFEVRAPLGTGRSVMRFVAVDNQGKRAERVITLIRDESAPRKKHKETPKVEFGEYHALLIGNEQYVAFNDLMTPKEDIHEIDRILRERYGFKTTIIEDGTRQQIMDGMYKLLGELTSEDNLLIYYAGHGEYVTDTGRGVWLPVDAKPDSPANWISNIEISDYLKQIRAKQIIVIADSCYSGALTRSALINLRPGLTDEEYEAQLRRMSKKIARVVLTSGGLAPVLDSASPDSSHSIFAGALIEVLNENDGILSGQDLSRTVAAKVSFVADDIGYEQEPQYAPLSHTDHQGGDFYFVPSTL